MCTNIFYIYVFLSSPSKLYKYTCVCVGVCHITQSIFFYLIRNVLFFCFPILFQSIKKDFKEFYSFYLQMAVPLTALHRPVPPVWLIYVPTMSAVSHKHTNFVQGIWCVPPSFLPHFCHFCTSLSEFVKNFPSDFKFSSRPAQLCVHHQVVGTYRHASGGKEAVLRP